MAPTRYGDSNGKKKLIDVKRLLSREEGKYRFDEKDQHLVNLKETKKKVSMGTKLQNPIAIGGFKSKFA